MLPDCVQEEDKRPLIAESDEPLRRERRSLTILYTVGLVVVTATVLLAYNVGYHNGSKQARPPRLPTHDITQGAFKPILKYFDMNNAGLVSLPENIPFVGPPRPEHEKAWEDLLSSFNIRIHRQEAAGTPFQSYELKDGSSDLWATPYVFHNLHCLKLFRELWYPERYPLSWELAKPKPDGNISDHHEHCLEAIRQAIMCQGDLTLLGWQWREQVGNDAPNPVRQLHGYPHLCVDWKKIQDWVADRALDVWNSTVMGTGIISDETARLHTAMQAIS